MKVRYTTSLLLLLLFTMSTHAQLKLQLGEHFLAGKNVKKLQVSPEDYTIWALTEDNKVYFKKPASADFELFTAVTGLQIVDLAGYNYDEMYFVQYPNSLIFVKSGNISTVTIADPLVIKINGIAIISPAYNASADIYDLRAGWLAIGTNHNFYECARNTNVTTADGRYLNQTNLTSVNWDLMRSSFKNATFRYNNPIDYCSEKSAHINTNIFNYTDYVNSYADLPPYSNDVHTGLMALHPLDLNNTGQYYYNRIINFWGTDKGMFAQFYPSCSSAPVRNYFSESVNGLSEADALTQINPQHYILAATDAGLQYTPLTVFGSDKTQLDINNIQFTALSDFPMIKATDVLVDSRKDPQYMPFVFVCDKVAWVSTTNGVYKVYLSYSAEAYTTVKANVFTPTVAPSYYDSNGDLVYERCGNDQVIQVGVFPGPNSQLKISWFKDDVEISELIGKQTVNFKDAGTYHAEVTSLCEGVTIKSYNIILKSAIDPVMEFNYADNIMACEGEITNLSTSYVAGYKYRWFKNDIVIDNATSSTYAVNTSGVYHVEVSRCGDYYKSSKNVNVSYTTFQAPVFKVDKAYYCYGDVATLSLQNPDKLIVKWYLDDKELTEKAGLSVITTGLSGNYRAQFVSGICAKYSTVYTLKINDPPNIKIIKSTDKALCPSETVTLSVNEKAASYLWSTGEKTSSITVSAGGNYSVQTISPNGCPGFTSASVTALPQIQLQGIADTSICTIARESLQITAETGYAFYIWNGIKTTDPSFNITQPGTYTLEVITVDGCTSKTSFTVKPQCKEVILKNSFTPNGDGINDLWTVGGIENDANANVKIYNRNGILLINFTGNNFGWDGRFKGNDLPAGTYYYIIKTKNSSKAVSGYVSLIR